MTHSDQTLIRRLTGARVQVGRFPGYGPIYRLSAYNASAQRFEALSEVLLVPHEVGAAEVLRARKDGILRIV